MTITLNRNIDIDIIECHTCSVPMYFTAAFLRKRMDDHVTFYCPNGHSNAYLGKTESQKLKERLADAVAENARITEVARLATAETLKVTKKLDQTNARIKEGVCPCCNRQFRHLQAHMKSKHPDQLKELSCVFTKPPSSTTKKPAQRPSTTAQPATRRSAVLP